MASIESAIERQNDLFGLIARAYENLKKLGEAKITRGQIQSRLDTLSANWSKFQDNHEKLCKARNDTVRQMPYFKDDLYSCCEDKFLEIKGAMLDLLDGLPSVSTPNATFGDVSMLPAQLSRSRRLPKVELPTFSGKYSDWSPFRDLFTSMVGVNNELTCVEKLHYLKMSVIDEPGQLLKNIAVSGENFSRAWELLVRRYENKRLLVDSHLSTLFSIKRMNSESSSEVKRLVGDVRESLGALESLGCSIKDWDPILVHQVSRKLDVDSLKDWEKKIGERTEAVEYSELESFLLGRIHALEAVESANGSRSKPTSFAKPQKQNVKSHAVMSREDKCILCRQNHYIASCPRFREKSQAERKDTVISKKLCYNCLGSHFLKNCRTLKRCQTCGRQHHTLLHANMAPVSDPKDNRMQSLGNSAVPSTSTFDPNSSVQTVSHTAHPQIISRSPVLLATVIVRVAHPKNGQFIEARALLDSGSESSFITEALCQQLQLPRTHATIPVIGVGAQQSGVTRGLSTFSIQSRVDQSFSCRLNALVLPRLTTFLPSFRLLVQDWPHLTGLRLADPDYNSPRPIDLILGADVYSYVILENIRKGSPGTPIAQNTRLGWVLSGSVPLEATVGSHCASVQGFQCSLDHELYELMQQFWLQEETPQPPQLYPEEKRCEEFFRETVSRDHSGRYIVRLPTKTDSIQLGNSRFPALRLFSRLEHRFQTQPRFKTAYVEFLREYSALGHMSHAVDLPKDPSRVFYLPHHGVLRESSTTTKLRVVFNGSQKTSTGFSLNDHLLVGPKLQLDLADVLLRWRTYQVVFSADIVKMYRQILVHEYDWDLQRILWRESEDQAILEYQLRTVTYGLSSAPYLAIRVLHQLVEDEGKDSPLGSSVIIQNMYVDDILSGADSLEEGREKMIQVSQLLAKGGFQLQKWAANVEDLLENISTGNRAASSSLHLDEDSVFKTLGLVWNSREDVFTFVPQRFSTAESLITKRRVLSQISQLFDPLGWLAPILIRAKVFMQNLWCIKLEWDEPLPEALALKWRCFLKDLMEISVVRIPRWIQTSASRLAIEIHGFSDASQIALAAVIYLRVTSENEESHVSLVCAKTKVAPLRKITIPRLELCAALILVRQVRHVIRVLDLSSVPVHLWSDSSVALAWIRGHPARWKDFVRNRVTEIQELEHSRWHYVASAENPADIASRGAAPEQVQNSRLWNSGPPWLSSHSVHWPADPADIPSETNEEQNQKVLLNHSSAPHPIWELVNRYSKLTRLLRITATCKKVSQKFKAQRSTLQKEICTRSITTDDLKEALLFWIKETQKAYFGNEILEFQKKSPTGRTHALASLAPFVDANGFLRVGGRLHHSDLEYDEKHPFILPRDSALSTLIVDHYHRSTLHGGTQLTLATIRQKFWILGGRVPVRRFIYRCVACARQRASVSSQIMGQLPVSRVSQSRPFLHSGVDYAGPFATLSKRSRGAKTYKSYIVIFVCFSTSAVHLELVSDYTSDAFLAAYKRFASRRGIPATLSSDCGRNLIGADAELQRLLSASTKEFEIIANELTAHGTQWRFNPPSAPHFGGKWEAGVKSVKFHLKRVIGIATLTFEEFSTLLSQIEAVLNSRPLCSISEDPTDLSILTPGHFLIGSALNTVPEPTLADVSPQRLSRWQLLRQKLEHFWKRWSTDYLQSLQKRTKWRIVEENVRVGAIVLIKNENYPPSVWPLARVIDVHPGHDGHVRTVTVKTSTSTFKRPITKLCVLPVATD